MINREAERRFEIALKRNVRLISTGKVVRAERFEEERQRTKKERSRPAGKKMTRVFSPLALLFSVYAPTHSNPTPRRCRIHSTKSHDDLQDCLGSSIMRPAFSLSQTCLRQKPQRLLGAFVRHQRSHFTAARWQFPKQLPRGRPCGQVIIWSAALSPAAFVALSEEDDGDGKTPEEHMLEASRAEIAKELPEDVHGVKRLWKGLLLSIDCYIVEPVATVLRFFHLVVIFVPVIGTLPILLLGSRQKDRDNERTGTLWWYSFLVRAMERGGPAFIKVLFTRFPAANAL